jgi:hypothetical protein
MVLVLGGVVLDEAPDSRNLYHAAPHLKEAAAHVASLPPKVVSPIGLLYLHQREFAVTLPHDSKEHMLHIRQTEVIPFAFFLCYPRVCVPLFKHLYFRVRIDYSN